MKIKNMLIAKNAGILFITDIASKAMKIGLTIIIARKLGVAELGVLGTALAFAELFSFIPNFGFKNFINREVARYPEKSGVYFSNIFLIKLVLSIFTLSAIIIVSLFIPFQSENILLYSVAAIVMLAESFIQFYTAFFRGAQKAEYEALILTTEGLLVAGSGIIVIWLGYGILNMLLIRFLVTLIVIVGGSHILKNKILKSPFTISYTRSVELLRSSVPFTILAILVIINSQSGVVLLSYLKGPVATGLYLAAFKLCGIFQFIPASVAGAILPAMTQFAKENQIQNLTKTFSKAIKYLLIFVLPIAAAVSILADKIIILLYNQDYVDSIFTLRVLIWVIVLSFSNTIFNVAFLSINREKRFVQVQVVGTILFLTTCLVLIPLIGHNGLAIAAVSTQFIVFIVPAFLIKRYITNFKLASIGFRPILAAIIMMSIIFLISSMNFYLILVIAVLIYFISLLGLKSFDADEIALFKTGINRLRLVFRK